MRSLKERETELKEKQVENMSKAQQDLTNLLLQQIRHQQEQTQQLIQQQQLQVQIQQQQMTATNDFCPYYQSLQKNEAKL